MSPRRASDHRASPCWEINREGIDGWEEYGSPHFPTREAAEHHRAEVLAEYGVNDGPVREMPYVCVPAMFEGNPCHEAPSAPSDARAVVL